MSARDAWVLLECDWAQTATGVVLHHVQHLDNPQEFADFPWGVGKTTCGVTTRLNVPGLFSRMDARRCESCAHILGLPSGIGSPKNDEKLQPWLDKRLAALPTPGEET